MTKAVDRYEHGEHDVEFGDGTWKASQMARLADRARNLATQARDTAPHYEHREIGYNYRLSNAGRHSRWLTTLTIDPARFGADREALPLALEMHDIESRTLWKPMHLQPVFAGCVSVGGGVSAGLFERGLCLPSGSSMSASDLTRVAGIARDCHSKAMGTAGAGAGA